MPKERDEMKTNFENLATSGMAPLVLFHLLQTHAPSADGFISGH